MSILINKNTRVIVSGITGHHGSFHTEKMLKFGTKIVAGVTPGKAGKKVCDVPVFNSVRDAVKKHKADVSILFVPAPHLKKAALDALKENLNLVIITEGVPVHDTLAVLEEAKKRKLWIVGPNCPGLVSAEESKVGIIPSTIVKKGDVGVVSRSGTLTYELIYKMAEQGLGVSTAVGIGGDKVVGSSFIDILKQFERDPQTKKILLVGEIGGNLEEKAAAFIRKKISKPVVAYIAGRTAPPEKKMGHAGAIILGKAGTAESKEFALESVGVKIARLPGDVIKLLK